MSNIFDDTAETYDRWYDTSEGQAIFNGELKCLRPLRGKGHGRWLEVGVGTGRFASALGIAKGIDPSPQMLKIAARRGIEPLEGRAEHLPLLADSFDGVLMALTLCFVQDSQQALKECRRVLRPGGRLLLGAIASNSPWGREYIEKASRKHPIYSTAHFRTAGEILELVRSTGFTLVDASSTLFWKPGEAPPREPRVEPGIIPEAGFLGLLFERTA